MISEYLDIFKVEYTKALDFINHKELEDAINAIKIAKNIYIIGNGGSANIANHFALDLKKTTNKGLSAISLCDSGLITAIGNDINFEEIFKYQLECIPKETKLTSILISFSTSGISPNIVKAVEYASKIGMTTITFTGAKGGRLLNYSHYPIQIINYDPLIIESIFSFLCHFITKILEKDNV